MELATEQKLWGSPVLPASFSRHSRSTE